MGYLTNGQCHESLANAGDSFFAGSPVGVSAGATSFLTWFEKVGGNWLVHRQSIDPSLVVTNSTVAATVPAFATCDPNELFFDGMTLGWFIAAVLLVVAGIKLLARGLPNANY